MQSTRGWEDKAGSPWISRGEFGGQIETPNSPHQISPAPPPLSPTGTDSEVKAHPDSSSDPSPSPTSCCSQQPATREHTTESQEQAVHRLYKQPLDRKMQQELELKQKLEAPDPSKRKLNPQEQERIVEHMYKRALAHIHGRK